MKLVIKLSLLLFLFGTLISYSQSKVVYIKFDNTTKDSCLVSIEGKGKKLLPKYRKNVTKTLISFYICNKQFTFIKDKFTSEKIEKNELKKIYFSDYNIINRAMMMKKNPPVLYIIEKTSSNHLCKYRVGYIHDFVLIN